MIALSAVFPAAGIYRAERVLSAVRDNAWLRFTQLADFRDRDRRTFMLVSWTGTPK